MSHFVRLSVVALIAATAIGCADESEPLGPLAPDAATTASAAPAPYGWDLPLMGDGALARAFPGEPCAAPVHRQFDFWVGTWNVYSLDGSNLAGTNDVTSELDGCVVQEHWTARAGFQGRSLNAYDRETGQWHQDWASQVPQGYSGRLRTAGGLVDGAMVMTGQRAAASGFTWLDEWSFTPTPEGDVIQTGVAFVPELGVTPVNFSALYRREAIDPAPAAVSPYCEPGAIGGNVRQADFLVGEWSVSGAGGPELGTASVSSELTECVFVETFESRGGLHAIAFTYTDVWTEEWHRIYVDSEGERLALSGQFDGTSLVLEGTEGTTAGDVEVRVTWTPEGANVSQLWEVSRDGGTTWQETARLIYEAM